ncbi:bifunctional DNA-formamidopyrimidine glycosylase/DNA-(apurinic or apyrimidinic site) lyase [Campylobacter fetus]|uniref:bifunctional DNA-formamidopyrimidine glycosylase/DNA-(apurinic or apyrimidinic site) lyase n=1 Tax=Campylobacter fetus TaxID=196 RepID=UPI000FCB2E13|nr:bifunctional DNA-formamidopyrimidine glycosylase/DNA-(apurinic or apyrimidinic site) lyase [Campylobacter fetus]RUT50552.1 DNA-formamidopyrimidine glycosylase [Campylobacter fetus]RUT50869.1 DNA-formamidopyrimidine glycosylase [Campylobacter fetus]
MPEMPEVETIRRIIEPQIAGQKVMSVIVNHPQIIGHPSAAEFVKLLSGQTFQNMSRRGKFLTVHFENGDSIVVHLRMTGQFLVTLPDYEEEKHTHLILNLSGGNQIRYIDVRRFGRFWYLKKDENDTVTGQDKLGVEPLDDTLTAGYLKAKLEKRKKAIKEMLHDQSIVAGIGNIYSDEILSAAGIYPEEKCADLTDGDWEILAEKIKEIIAWGINTNEMTPEEYLTGKGKEYSNIPNLRVYGREGLSCRKCGSTIERIVIGGRSSCYCPKCQKKRKQ